jgi:hypothetical protein
MKLNDSPQCAFCKNGAETIEHLFWECPISKSVIENLFPTRVFPFCNIKHFILGYTDKNSNAVNIAFIYAKYYLYRCKMASIQPTTENGRHFIKSKYENLKSIAVYQNKYDTFEHDWENVVANTLLITN